MIEIMNDCTLSGTISAGLMEATAGAKRKIISDHPEMADYAKLSLTDFLAVYDELKKNNLLSPKTSGKKSSSNNAFNPALILIPAALAAYFYRG